MWDSARDPSSTAGTVPGSALPERVVTNQLTMFVIIEGCIVTDWRLLVASVITPDTRAASAGFPAMSAASISSCRSASTRETLDRSMARSPPSSESDSEQWLVQPQVLLDAATAATPSVEDVPLLQQHRRVELMASPAAHSGQPEVLPTDVRTPGF